MHFSNLRRLSWFPHLSGERHICTMRLQYMQNEVVTLAAAVGTSAFCSGTQFERLFLGVGEHGRRYCDAERLCQC